MTDIATLGLRVDSSQVGRATRVLDRFGWSARRADRSSSSLTRTTAGLGRGMRGFAGGLLGPAGAIGATLALGLALRSVISAAADFEVGMNKVLAVSGASAQQFDSLRGKALELGSSTKFTATQVSEAMGFMAMAGQQTTEILGGIAPVLNLAASA